MHCMHALQIALQIALHACIAVSSLEYACIMCAFWTAARVYVVQTYCHNWWTTRYHLVFAASCHLVTTTNSYCCLLQGSSYSSSAHYYTTKSFRIRRGAIRCAWEVCMGGVCMGGVYRRCVWEVHVCLAHRLLLIAHHSPPLTTHRSPFSALHSPLTTSPLHHSPH